MRVRVVRTAGELKDSIGHKVMVRKGWEGEVVHQLETEEEIREAGFHPKLRESYYEVLFDEWEQTLVVPGTYLVLLPDTDGDEE